MPACLLSRDQFDRIWEHCRDYSINYGDMKTKMINEIFYQDCDEVARIREIMDQLDDLRTELGQLIKEPLP